MDTLIIMVITPLSLEECIRNYDRENSRKESLESKASYFLVIVSILTAIWLGVISYVITKEILSSLSMLFLFFSLITLIFIGLSCFFAFEVLKVRKYNYPLDSSNPNVFISDLSVPENELLEDLFERYSVCFSINILKNNEKAKFLKKSQNYLFYTVILSIITLVIFGAGL